MGTAGDESERLRPRRRGTGAADAGVAMLETVEEKDRRLRGVYGVERVVAGLNGEV